MANKKPTPNFVISEADEGVQINEGTRLGFVGAGVKLDDFSQVIKILKNIFSKNLRLAASSQSLWIKQQSDLNQWDEVDALFQQQAQALANHEKLLYAGFLPFEDPQEISHNIKGHMVRPKDVHLANKICFTLGGGEQVYNLGQYLISADWISQAPLALAKKLINTQVDFLQNSVKKPCRFVCQTGGMLGEAVANKNRKVLEKLGYELSE
jgi:hypothetical protein